MKTLVVLPSYNEIENITRLIGEIIKLGDDYFVLVVDDNSPDGTANEVRSYVEKNNQSSRVHMIVREKKDGRGGAIRDGFIWGRDHTEHNFENFVEMDCDFSHPPEDIPKGISMLNEPDVDLVLGSRYPDGKIVGWPLKKKVVKFFCKPISSFINQF